MVIVGGGIVGLATAYHLLLRTPALKVVVLEKESELGQHQSSHNSGVIHSGLYYKPGSLKAKNCVSGYRKLLDFCRDQNVPFELCGKLVVATSEDELPRLEELRNRGEANGLTGIKTLSREEILEHEPHCTGIKGLLVPQTGIIEFKKVVDALARRVAIMDGEIFLSSEALEINQSKSGVEVITVDGTFTAHQLVNCAGLYSDRVARLANTQCEVRIIPFRGEYYTLNPARSELVHNLIYPVPNPAFPFLGVHFTRMMSGGIEIGPNAVLAMMREGYKKSDLSFRDLAETLLWPGFHTIVKKYWRDGAYEMYRSISKRAFLKASQTLIPALTMDDLIPGGSGVRAQACGRDGGLIDDFMILEEKGLTHVLNAPSPAATSSLSIGETVARKVLGQLGLI